MVLNQSATDPPNVESADQKSPRVTELSINEQADFCWKVIQRYDAYINGSNSKAAILLTFNSFVLGTIVLKWSEIFAAFDTIKMAAGIIVVLLFITAVASAFSMWLGLIAIIPILASAKESQSYRSLIFFRHVAELEAPEAYIQALGAATTSSLSEDLAKQAYALSVIAATKFVRLIWAVRCIVYVQLPAILLMALTASIVTFIDRQWGGQN